MVDWFTHAFSGSGFTPHGVCIAWSPTLLWLLVLSNLAIVVAYWTIPIALWRIAKHRADIRFSGVLLMFAAFIFACGATHLLDIVSLWWPVYWLDGWIGAATGVISLATVAVLWKIIPIVQQLPSPQQLSEANIKLSEEIQTRREKEDALLDSEDRYRELSGGLEKIVAERTAELAEANRRLQREVEEREHMQHELRELNHRLEEALQQQAEHSNEMVQLNRVGDLMQSCVSVAELTQVLSTFASGFLNAPRGAVYLTDAATDGMVALEAEWGKLPEVEHSFPANACWALRRGLLHPSDNLQRALHCQHVSDDSDHVCVPLIGNGETLGMLHLREPGQAFDPAFLDGVAKRAALALISLRMRDALFDEATHDPLTGLYNRRHLDNALGETERRARRSNRSVGVMMLDLDHFKAVNDQYGHDVGDVVLKAFADKLRACLRGGDIPCRYGGEEFIVLLSGASLAATSQRAEQFRAALAQMTIQHRGIDISVTTSIGIGAFPECGPHLSAIIKAADLALYAAKHAGRNRVVAANPYVPPEEPEEPNPPAPSKDQDDFD